MEDMRIESEKHEKEIWVIRVMEKLLPMITLEELKDATVSNPELSGILKAKKEGYKTTAQSKGP